MTAVTTSLPHWRALVLCATALCASAAATAAEAPRTLAPGVELMQADFGLFNTEASGKPAFVPAKVVPHVPGQGYGWIIALRNERSTVTWREEFNLPAKPASWGQVDEGALARVFEFEVR